jgi:hypothetical protein
VDRRDQPAQVARELARKVALQEPVADPVVRQVGGGVLVQPVEPHERVEVLGRDHRQLRDGDPNLPPCRELLRERGQDEREALRLSAITVPDRRNSVGVEESRSNAPRSPAVAFILLSCRVQLDACRDSGPCA